MNTKLTVSLFGFGALLMASQADAATVQLIPANPTVINGGAFTMIVQAVDFASTNGGGFTLTWDPVVLLFSSAEFQIRNELFINGLGVNNVSITQGRLDVVRTRSPTVPLSGNFDLVTLVFTAWSVGVTDISFVANQPAWVDENDVELATALQPNYVGASIIATTPEGNVPGVPIPTAIWLFGSGLIGLIGIARRKQSA